MKSRHAAAPTGALDGHDPDASGVQECGQSQFDRGTFGAPPRESADIKNHSRIIRALEIIKHTGDKFSSLRKDIKKIRNFKTQVILLECPREILYNRINSRVDTMISNGLEEEAFNLKKYSKLNTLNTVGYKEFFNYFENKLSYNEAIEKIKQNTRNYAKRQITWNKKYYDAIKVSSLEDSKKIINQLNI